MNLELHANGSAHGSLIAALQLFGFEVSISRFRHKSSHPVATDVRGIVECLMYAWAARDGGTVSEIACNAERFVREGRQCAHVSLGAHTPQEKLRRAELIRQGRWPAVTKAWTCDHRAEECCYEPTSTFMVHVTA